MVGMTRFERATPSSQARCSTKLSHIPAMLYLIFNFRLAHFGYNLTGRKLLLAP